MKSDTWITCHVNAYNYFGGTTRLLIPDNLKTGITRNTRYETVLNRSYYEMAEYYQTAIVPGRVRHPKDKSHAENSVEYASTWIIAALRNQKFFMSQARAIGPNAVKAVTHFLTSGRKAEQGFKFCVSLLKLAEKYGKTYIACALGNAACRKFYSVRYVRMPEFLDELAIARSANESQKVLKAYKKVDLLIIDKWLIRKLTQQESFEILELAEARIKKSIIFCTQYGSVEKQTSCCRNVSRSGTSVRFVVHLFRFQNVE